MNIWDVLKIEQTKDKDALKKAYRMRLSSVNPEDDPEGFMELRKAYEEAVHLADQTEEEFDVAIPDTPEQQMLASLEALYDDYARRINPDEWLALFNSDYFVSLDTSESKSFWHRLCLATRMFCFWMSQPTIWISMRLLGSRSS